MNVKGGNVCSINNFFANCRFVDPKTNLANESIKNHLIDMHPTQWIGDKVIIKIYQVRYSYNTARGNYRIGSKYFMINEPFMEAGDFDYWADMYLHDWVEARNKKWPYKAISNVKILDVEPYANSILFIA